MKITVEAVRHADIKGKELLYLILGEDKDRVIINIGEKTFQSVKDLLYREEEVIIQNRINENEPNSNHEEQQADSQPAKNQIPEQNNARGRGKR